MQLKGTDPRSSELRRDLGQNIRQFHKSPRTSLVCGRSGENPLLGKLTLTPTQPLPSAFPFGSPLSVDFARTYCLIRESHGASGWYMIRIPMVKIQETDTNKSNAKGAQGYVEVCPCRPSDTNKLGPRTAPRIRHCFLEQS